MILDRPLRFGPEVAQAAGAVAAIAGDERPGAGEEQGDDGASVVRFWRSTTERAEAQAAAREIEHLLAAGEVPPEAVCVIVGSGWREARLVAAALEERAVPFRFAGDAALFQRPEVRDVLAWLRMLADPTDSAAVVRALTRPPVELALDRPGSLHRHRAAAQARHDLGARRRPREPPAAAGGARPDPGLPQAPALGFRRAWRRCGPTSSFAASSSASACGATGCSWRRPRPRSGSRASPASPSSPPRGPGASPAARFATSSGTSPPSPTRASSTPTMPRPHRRGSVVLAEPEQVKGLEFEHVYVLGLHRGALARPRLGRGMAAAEPAPERALSRGRGRDQRAAPGPASHTCR